MRPSMPTRSDIRPPCRTSATRWEHGLVRRTKPALRFRYPAPISIAAAVA